MSRQLSQEYPKSTVCEVLGLARSSFYYKPEVNDADQPLLAAIEQMLMRWPFYGYRRVTQQLKREGWEVGETRVRRLLKVLDHTASVGRVHVTTTDSQHNLRRYPNRIKRLAISRINQVWVADITYIRLGCRFIYLALILDAYSRGLRGWNLGRSLEKELTIDALKMALERYPAPEIHHSDQGKQYAATEYLDLLGPTVTISMSATGQPTENGLIERFIRTFKEEHIDYTEYSNFDDAYQQIEHWVEVEYMTERIHSALDYVTPAEFETALIASAESPLLNA
jgi:putative transposase